MSHGEDCLQTQSFSNKLNQYLFQCKPGAANLALYLLEPKTCSYILGLESQLLCQLLTDVDENGLIQL